MNLRSWLKRPPVAVAVRCVLADESERIVRVASQSRTRWSDAERAIEGIGPSRVEALDDKGQVLRSSALDDDDDGGADESERTTVLDANDRDVRIATLLVDAADRAAARHEGAYRAAFDQLTAIVRAQSDRQAGLEKALARLMADLERRASEPASDDVPAAMITSLMGRVTGAKTGSGA